MTTVRWREQTPLVGREAELSKLADLLRHVRVGHSGVVFVVGEPGIGKTRLLVELAQRARRQDWHVLLGHAYESEGMPPYLPFTEALRDYVRACPPDEARDLLQAITPDVARLLPDVATPLTVGEGDSSLELDTRDPKAHRYRLFEHLCDVVFKVASSPQGLLVCLDDLHWADEPTLQLLLHLVRRLDEAPVLLVCSYRSTASGAGQALTDTLAEMNRQRLCHRLVIDALSRDELGSLITYLGGPATPVVTDMIHRQTGGNPYFACELVRHLQDEGHDL